jgi:hypothetical protein
MRRKGRNAVPYTLALGALSFLYLDYPTPSTAVPVPLPANLPRLLAAPGPSCPLPVGKQVKAVGAFREMMPVFRHPRCINCHGAFDIASEAHEGSEVVEASGLDPQALLTAQERKKLHESCGNCHDNIEGHLVRRQLNDSVVIEGWLIAPPPMRWTGKDDGELCMLMKRFEATGDQFVDHLNTDHREIQFIKAAFHGDRGLGAALKGKPEAPPGTPEELVDKAQKWVDLVGKEGYTASPECGCVMPKIKLKIHHTWLFEVPGGLPSRQSSEAAFEVSLRPVKDRPGYLEGEFSLNRRIDLTLPRNCSGNGNVKERWLLKALMDPKSGSVTIWHTQLDEEPTGQIECRQGGGTGKMGIDPGVLAGTLGAGEMVIPADSTSKKVEASELDTKESLTITVLEVPTAP